MLNHRGYIYTAKHEGWYSVSDETFYPQTQVQKTLDPETGQIKMVSTALILLSRFKAYPGRSLLRQERR